MEFSGVELLIWYMVGALLHVFYRWSRWKVHNPPTEPWLLYWRAHLATNVSALIMALIVAFVWVENLLTWFVGMVGIDTGTWPEIPRNPLTSLAAGFLLEYLAAGLISRFERRVPAPAGGG